MGFQAIVSWGIVLIAADLASAEKEPASVYFKPYFPHYFKSVSTFYNEPTVSPYQSQLSHSAYGTLSLNPPLIIKSLLLIILNILLLESTSSMEISREGRSPFRYFYTCKYY